MSQFLSLAKAYRASAAILPRRILALDAKGEIKIAASPADRSIGVSDGALETPMGHSVDVLLSGIQKLDLGGAVGFGDFLTADASGRAVIAASGNRAIGVALGEGAAGDEIDALIAPCKG